MRIVGDQLFRAMAGDQSHGVIIQPGLDQPSRDGVAGGMENQSVFQVAPVRDTLRLAAFAQDAVKLRINIPPRSKSRPDATLVGFLYWENLDAKGREARFGEAGARPLTPITNKLTARAPVERRLCQF